MIYRPYPYLVSLLCFALLAEPVRGQASAAQEVRTDTEIQKLGTVLESIRKRNAADYAITTPNRIAEAMYVEVGGIEHWVTVRGEDRENPVLLFLHGGPGDSTNLWGHVGFRSWLKDFTVVQWDQRGAGRTLGRNGPEIGPTITVDRMVRDGLELSEWLRKHLRQEKIVLVGHSWGSILGVLMAKARPELFYAFVGTGQVADPARNYIIAYDELVKEAEARGELRAIRELRETGPPPYLDGRGFAVQRRWSNILEGADLLLASMFALALSAPEYSLRDVNDWLDGQGLSGERLVPETSVLEAKALGGDFAVPVVVIQGAKDFTTPTSLAEAFVQSIRAPHKAFVTIEDGGHFAVFMRSDAFLRQLILQVVPLVTRR